MDSAPIKVKRFDKFIMGSGARLWKLWLMGACVMLLAAISVAINLVWGMSFVSTFYHTRRAPGIIDTVTLSPIIEVENQHEAKVDLVWEEMAEAPVARLDGAAVQIRHLLYVFSGYANIDEVVKVISTSLRFKGLTRQEKVHAHVDIYNLSNNTWESRIGMPKAMAHSHLGMATDGRFIYAVAGQFGSQCGNSTSLNFVLDTKTRTWSSLLPLPVSRYAPATQLWRGRLHVMGGSREDRYEPAQEHWSLAVRNGKALEFEWRHEVPIPRGGPHRACVVTRDRLYVIGGQEGDFKAKLGSPIFKCSRQKEVPLLLPNELHISKGMGVVYGDMFMLEENAKRWKQLSSMPEPNSHIEFAWVTVNHGIVIVGGSTEKNPLTKKLVLLDTIFLFNTHSQVWKILGHMPYRAKTVLAAYWEGWLYFTSGQRDKGALNPEPKRITARTWRTKLHAETY